jgi:hypothetical protein
VLIASIAFPPCRMVTGTICDRGRLGVSSPSQYARAPQGEVRSVRKIQAVSTHLETQKKHLETKNKYDYGSALQAASSKAPCDRNSSA